MSNRRYDHIRNSVVLSRKKSRNSYAIAPSAPAIPQRQVFGNVCAAIFFWRIRFLRTCLNNEWSGTSSRILEGQSGKTSVVNKVARRSHRLHHTHVSLFLHRTKSAFCSKNTVTCTERVTPRVFFFRLCTHAVLVNNTRSGSWNAARERMKAVSFGFFCFSEKSQPRAWTWDHERELRR